jgi:hypothetical protein
MRPARLVGARAIADEVGAAEDPLQRRLLDPRNHNDERRPESGLRGLGRRR